MKKRLLSLALALALALALCLGLSGTAMAAPAASGKLGGTLTWSLDGNGTLTISGTGEIPDTTFLIPLEYQKLVTNIVVEDGVTSIADYAFETIALRENLVSVTIPASVTKIGEMFGVKMDWDFTIYGYSGTAAETFAKYPSLSTLHFTFQSLGESENGVQNDAPVLYSAPFGDVLFDPVTGTITRCDRRSDVIDLPASINGVAVTGIGDGVFSDCSSLRSVTIPDSVTSIGRSAFSCCTDLTSITIPSSVTSIGDNAFGRCTGLTSITIPSGVTSMGAGTFTGCTGLTSVIILSGVTSIGAGAFSNCPNLTNVTIFDGVISVEEDAFYNCTGLTSVTIPDGVTTLEKCAFYGCTGLTSVYIPSSITSFGEYVFDGCTNFTDIYYGGSEEEWKAIAFTESYNDTLVNATIHYNSAAPEPSVPTTPVAPIPPVGTAYATTYSILVDGKPVAFDAYALRDENNNDTNYLKLRDVAYVLNGSAAQFNVGWDGASGSISLTTRAAYTTPNGLEMATPFSGNQPYRVSSAAILVNGVRTDLSAITLTDANGGDYTYFKLRDLGKYLGFDVDWDNDARAIIIDTTRPYSE